MKAKTILTILFLTIIMALFIVDRNIWMERRVLKVKVWEYDSGDSGFCTNNNARALIYTDNIISFKKNTIVFKNNIGSIETLDTLVMKWSYLGKLRIVDPKTNKSATYVIFNKI